MRVAVIPARGGSKRIPRKNIKPFCGRPMIVWSIAAAKESGCFDRIIVSTDDEEIAMVARANGAEVPFMRPTTLADDFTGTADVVAHAIHALAETRCNPSEVCCIYATAPFVAAADIRQGLSQLLETDAQFVFSVTSYPSPIQRALRLNANCRVEMFHPECFVMRSQDLEPAWHDAGQFYWGRVAAWLPDAQIFSREASVVILPRYRVQDIDTPEDWRQAELLFSCLQQHLSRGDFT